MKSLILQLSITRIEILLGIDTRLHESSRYRLWYIIFGI